MRAHHLLMLVAAALCSACFDNPGEYPQHLIGTWRMDGKVLGKPAEGVLHIMREGDYILDNGASTRAAQVAPSGTGHWSLLRDQLELMAQEASPMSGVGLEQTPSHRLFIVSLNQNRLVTSDPDYGVKIEWVRVGPLN